MPSIEANRKIWGRDYDWSGSGEEWSTAWGGSMWHWYWTIRPRLFDLLPAENVVEIAPGYGRWTEYLRREAENLVGIDLSPRCVQACRERFAAYPGLQFRETDGSTLTGVEDDSIDFVFSFDSLVHVEADAVEGYVGEIRRVLRPTGAAILHHSNLLALDSLEGQDHGRARTVSGELMLEMAERHGLTVSYQELIPWGAVRDAPLDAITILSAEQGRGPAEPFVNLEFMREAQSVARIAARSPLGSAPSA